jgi:hypothetical protein
MEPRTRRTYRWRARSMIPWGCFRPPLQEGLSYSNRKAECEVYNLVVQRDNRSNLKMAAASRDIAEVAKNDSSAMRTSGFMSIVFLPTTFVAVSRTSSNHSMTIIWLYQQSFFLMSMLDWKAPSWAYVAFSRMWLYWAISVPPILIIMVMWYPLWCAVFHVTRRWS